MPKICVIVPTRNVMPYLDRFFDAINKINYPIDDVTFVFADGQSKDGTFEYLTNKQIKFPKIVVTKEKSTRPNARNAAYRYILDNLEYDFICTIDADVLVYPEFFNKLLKHFDDPKVGMVASYFMYEKNEFLIDYTNSYLGSKMGKVVNTGSCPTGCAIFRKECFDYFDEAFICHEDGDLALRITEKGWKGLQDFTQTCAHLKNQSTEQELRELYGMGYYEPLLWMKHKSYLRGKILLGSLYYIAFLFSIPAFALAYFGVINELFAIPFSFMFAVSFVVHFFQIKNGNPFKKLAYSMFTITRFWTYYIAVLSRLVRIPFQKIKFNLLG